MVPSLAGVNLTIQAGACWVDGHYCELLGSQVLAATANGLAVVRFDPAANTAELLWRDGATVPAQAPTGTWELPIAKVAGSVLTDGRAILNPTGLVFANNTARDFWTNPPDGAHIWTPEGGGANYERRGGVWVLVNADSWATASFSAPTLGGNCTMTLGANKNWAVQDAWSIRPLVEGLYIVMANVIRSGAPGGINTVVDATINAFAIADVINPKASVKNFTNASGGYWVGFSVTGWMRLSPVTGDYVRVLGGGDGGGVIDSRSSLWIARVAAA